MALQSSDNFSFFYQIGLSREKDIYQKNILVSLLVDEPFLEIDFIHRILTGYKSYVLIRSVLWICNAYLNLAYKKTMNAITGSY